jgi:hypothetical protein
MDYLTRFKENYELEGFLSFFNDDTKELLRSHVEEIKSIYEEIEILAQNTGVYAFRLPSNNYIYEAYPKIPFDRQMLLKQYPLDHYNFYIGLEKNSPYEVQYGVRALRSYLKNTIVLGERLNMV